jgi:hypothetical protein
MNFTSRKTAVCVAICTLLLFVESKAQTFDLTKVNTITTAVPFLRIVNDTRSGGMGDVGVAMSADANGAQVNGAKMAFIENDFGVGLSFTPWLKSLVDDIYLANLSGYYRIKNVQTVHASLRYFSLGQINFRDEQNNELGTRRPQEIAFDAGYSRKFADIFSVGVTLRFIYSSIAPGTPTVTGDQIKPGIAGAGDISWLVNKTFDTKGNSKMKHQLFVGMNLSNLGSKITYTTNVTRDFIPANLGFGVGYSLHLDEKHTISAYMDVNRLLVPTPIQARDLYINGNNGAVKPEYDQNGNGVADYRERSSVSAMFTSFADAPGGSAEELKETNLSVGLEYFYKKMFGVRAGYFYEDPTKGARQFMTVGASVKYSVATLHLSYLVPTTALRNPLDNTFRFSLNFEFNKGGKKAADTQSTTSEPLPKDIKPRQMRLDNIRQNDSSAE